MTHAVLLLPVLPANSVFGSAPDEYWRHANFRVAHVDGGEHAYLHVPCHRGDEAELTRLDAHWRARGKLSGYRETYPDRGPCEACDFQGWRMTSHRLRPMFSSVLGLFRYGRAWRARFPGQGMASVLSWTVERDEAAPWGWLWRVRFVLDEMAKRRGSR